MIPEIFLVNSLLIFPVCGDSNSVDSVKLAAPSVNVIITSSTFNDIDNLFTKLSYHIRHPISYCNITCLTINVTKKLYIIFAGDCNLVDKFPHEIAAISIIIFSNNDVRRIFSTSLVPEKSPPRNNKNFRYQRCSFIQIGNIY